MATRQNPLPVPAPEYDVGNEAITRRTIEQAMDQIENDVIRPAELVHREGSPNKSEIRSSS